MCTRSFYFGLYIKTKSLCCISNRAMLPRARARSSRIEKYICGPEIYTAPHLLLYTIGFEKFYIFICARAHLMRRRRGAAAANNMLMRWGRRSAYRLLFGTQNDLIICNAHKRDIFFLVMCARVTLKQNCRPPARLYSTPPIGKLIFRLFVINIT